MIVLHRLLSQVWEAATGAPLLSSLDSSSSTEPCVYKLHGDMAQAQRTANFLRFTQVRRRICPTTSCVYVPQHLALLLLLLPPPLLSYLGSTGSSLLSAASIYSLRMITTHYGEHIDLKNPMCCSTPQVVGHLIPYQLNHHAPELVCWVRQSCSTLVCFMRTPAFTPVRARRRMPHTYTHHATHIHTRTHSLKFRSSMRCLLEMPTFCPCGWA